MTTVGTVRRWHDEEGWGVIDSPDTPGGCWAHYSNVAVTGHESLNRLFTDDGVVRGVGLGASVNR